MYRRGFSPYVTVFTRASTVDADRRMFPFGQPRGSASVKSVMCMAEVYTLTADVRVHFAYQESDNLETWPAASSWTVIGTTSTNAVGFFSNDGFEAIALTKAYVRFGVLVRNDAGGSPKYEFALIAARFDTRAC